MVVVMVVVVVVVVVVDVVVVVEVVVVVVDVVLVQTQQLSSQNFGPDVELWHDGISLPLADFKKHGLLCSGI